ncbi:copper resistance protein B [Luteimonas sp. S4-F44]|uniref:copper resistance protein B n=1 Tax=Luteimonas sp. S4-F44 TaxID=2925842 RepID=UPI001F53519E|nr:copper resistance protein B [Luteimonas sp. S4-F44]UNK44133.1 copper resistance protein B [Luteimonas sp. S4-F44]
MDRHAGHASAPGDLPSDALPRTPIPALSDDDRAAAFPSLHPHAMGDSAIRHFVRVDRLEGFDTDHGHGLGWEVDSWIGGDLHRVWLKSSGERVAGRTHDASVDALYGRSVSPWWDVVAGAHHVFAPGRAKTYASVGVQGLAPYFFEVSAMAHVDDRGRVLAELEIEYEWLLTNRLILQPAVELAAASEADPERRIGSGLGEIEAGLRLRYEVTRRFAPYIGLVHARSFGQTRALEQADGGSGRETRWVIGVRTWF